MIEILKNLINLGVNFINSIYNFEIDFYDNVKIKIGTLFIAILLFALLIYVVFNALGFSNSHEKKGDDN